MDIVSSRTAVLGLHWMRDVVLPEGALGQMFGPAAQRSGIVKQTERLLTAARSKNVAIVYTRVCYQPGYPDLVVNAPLCQALGRAAD